MSNLEYIQQCIRDVPDFPKPGILFKDIAPLVEDPKGFAATIDLLAERWADSGVERIAGLESRGFIFGCALAYKLGVGTALLRKPGKLPSEKVHVEYSLEYGTDRIEMHTDAVAPGMKVLIVDDLLATGGTAGAALKLLTQQGANVIGCAFVIELGFLNGRHALGDVPVDALLTY
jgi:adenine phosphoribosyltransferase